MSVEERTKIDLIAVRPGSNVVRLVITDHLDWSDFQRHALLIQEKVNTYIGFVESGELRRVQHPPIPDSPVVTIVLTVQHQPSAEAEAFLAKVADFLKAVGFPLDIDRRYIDQ